MRAPGAYRQVEVTMAKLPEEVYLVQAWHYAQYESNEDGSEVEILDEDDCEMVIVAVRATLRAAEKVANDYNEACRTVPDSEDPVEGHPISTINILKAFTSGPPRPNEFVKNVVDNTVGSG